MLNLLGAYKNGNYTVKVLSDGTKIRETNDDEFIPAFAENCDVKITDKCDGSCPFCYEGCTPYGRHGDILNYKFLDTLHPYTELAINGNDLSHPDLIPFLEKMKDKHIITNMTVNQIHFERHYDFISELVSKKLIYGLGVSLRNPTVDFIAKIKKFPNAVIHCINGILTPNDYEILKDNDLKMLILGYKQLRRGVVYYEFNGDEVHELQNWLYDNLEDMLNHFKVISFDNLAIEQLEVKRLLDEDQWEEFYMGDDGKYTFYIDMVDGTFGKNSLATERYPIMDSIDEMFQKVLNEGVEL
jgi:hypothetical protein